MKDKLRDVVEYLVDGLVVIAGIILVSASIVVGIDLGLKIVGIY